MSPKSTEYRKTKIIFTIGPATSDEATLERLIEAGVDICRINMAHADHAWTRKLYSVYAKSVIGSNARSHS